MNLTFMQVLEKIEVGQKYVGGDFAIEKSEQGIEVKRKDESSGMFFGIKWNGFKLERKMVDFQTAFKAYKEGKEIESLVEFSGKRYKYKIMEGENWCMLVDGDYRFICASIKLGEIEGKWFIND